MDGTITDMVENATPKRRRAIINNAIIRQADGTYKFNPKDKSISRVQTRQHTQRAGTHCRGIGKQEARTRCGGEGGLAEAIREGNVTVQVDAYNRERYYFDHQVADDLSKKHRAAREGPGEALRPAVAAPMMQIRAVQR